MGGKEFSILVDKAKVYRASGRDQKLEQGRGNRLQKIGLT